MALGAEIDLVTLEAGPVLHFTEVKAWRSDEFAHPLETFRESRVEKIKRTAEYFLRELYETSEGRALGARFSDIFQGEEEPELSFNLLWIDKNGAIEFYDSLLFET